jgi:hypothetical protein
MRSPQPSLALLTTFSESSLEGFELARLDEISKLRREIQEIRDEWVEAEVAARLARLLLEGRRMLHPSETASLAQPDPCVSAKRFAPAPQTSDAPPAKTAMSSLLAREHRKKVATNSPASSEPDANFLLNAAGVSCPLEPAAMRSCAEAAASVPFENSQAAASAAPAISPRPNAARRCSVRSRKDASGTSAKIQSTTPRRRGATSQLALFAETQSAPQHADASRLRQPAIRVPSRPVLYLTRRPSVLASPTFSLRDFRAAS